MPYLRGKGGILQKNYFFLWYFKLCNRRLHPIFQLSHLISDTFSDFRHLGLVLNFALGKWSRGNKGSRMLGAGGVTKEPEKQGVH